MAYFLLNCKMISFFSINPTFGQVGIMCTHWAMACWLSTSSLFWDNLFIIVSNMLHFTFILNAMDHWKFVHVLWAFTSHWTFPPIIYQYVSTNHHMDTRPFTSHTQHCSLSLSLSPMYRWRSIEICWQCWWVERSISKCMHWNVLSMAMLLQS